MKVLIIDNYDSFTFNLYQYLGEILLKTGKEFTLDVVRNDAITLPEIKKKGYEKIILSPGPGDPRDANYFGICSEVILRLGKETPIFGVCLGVQGIAAAFGGNIIRAESPMHGKTSTITHTDTGVFVGLPQNLAVMRYHSLIIEKETLPSCFEITAVAQDTNEIMGLRHKTLPIEGVQFHPESFATEGGKLLLANFLFEK